MRLSGWMGLIAALVGIGALQVSQRTAIVLSGYAVGSRMERVHDKETEVAWLDANVTGLASPGHLADVAKERRLNMVARSMLPLPSIGLAREPQAPGHSLQLAAGDDTSD